MSYIFKEIRKNIKPKYPHTYQEILIAFYQPLEYDMILDGRHRYIEAEAFSLNKKLPVIHLHSDEIISALVDLNSFLNYIIVRKIGVKEMGKIFSVEFLIQSIPQIAVYLPITLLITIASCVAGLIVGFFIALARYFEVRVLKTVAKVYISFIRGTPTMVQLVLV